MTQLIKLLIPIAFLASICLVCYARPGPKATLPRPKECGNGQSDRLINTALPFLGEYPWTALIQYRKPDGKLEFSCGGSLINARYILTAAHCISGIPKNWKIVGVRLGEHDLSNAGPDCEDDLCADLHIDMTIDKLIVHEDHNNLPRSQWDDIALIRFDRDVTFSEYIRPICLPLDDELRTSNTTGLRVTEVGWSRTVGSRISDTKMRTELEILNRTECDTAYQQQEITLRDTQLCVSRPKLADVCHGIAGSSLMQRVGDSLYLIGITSFGPTGCGKKNIPDVYTKVASYVDWIESKME
ncbi:CLIP domain-containing serine protease B4-like [Culex pipiens pallens]|uniref:CLIP domain-containing serine protease B4-like n=1 Tax=Culex pipiens pallens TaxID=42434 RepID=UPI0019540E6B|nr:CLIP domain-containing serine protease B4-like [Culex pipiens pallens]